LHNYYYSHIQFIIVKESINFFLQFRLESKCNGKQITQKQGLCLLKVQMPQN